MDNNEELVLCWFTRWTVSTFTRWTVSTFTRWTVSTVLIHQVS